MSYPRTIQTLVIEDEPGSKEYFEAVFDKLKSSHQIAPPHWAFCLDDAKTLLGQDRIYHLVTVDLCLPEQPDLPPSESVEFGLSLIRECVNRNGYPVPALLVISGHLGQARQQDLTEHVRKSFAYGRVLVKSDHLEEEIEQALSFVEHYCDVGIHIKDGGTTPFPTISPREEDILRQAVLVDRQRIGLDLRWWSAGYEPYSGWTKTLMGRYLLDEGRGHSLYTFFKLAAAEGADNVFREAEVMSQKLKHVKIVATIIAGDRSLLATQSAGSGNSPPLSLDDLLSRPTSGLAEHLPRIAVEIVNQIAALGDRTPDQREIRQLLWRHHDQQRLETQWQQRGGDQVLAQYGVSVTSPIELYKALVADTSVLRHDRQGALHGDLNYTNIAIEDYEGRISAFVFDASGSEAGVCIRDLATLEVTALLHQQSDEGVVAACMALYADGHATPMDSREATDRQRNTFMLIQSIREAALRRATPDVYALMVLDQALLQLGGLSFGSSYNKISNMRDACLLAALASRWYRAIRGTSDS